MKNKGSTINIIEINIQKTICLSVVLLYRMNTDGYIHQICI